MPSYIFVCPTCGTTTTKYRSATKAAPPRYCSLACYHADPTPPRATTRQYHYTPAMEEAMRRACRGKPGGLKTLWRTDPRFAAIPYPSVRRHAWTLGAIRSEPGLLWSPDEEAYAERAFLAWRPLDSMATSMRRLGWRRSPGAIRERMTALGVTRRQGDSLSLAQVALSFGVDAHVVARWVGKGWLPVHHVSDGIGEVRYVSYTALRRFVAAYPTVVAKGQPDLVWLIGLLTEPSMPSEGQAGGGDGSDWMDGEVVRLRGIGD